jgi:hypothetical protein
MSARILFPSESKWTRPPVPRTNWYASATATQVSQFSLNAIATFVGVTVDGVAFDEDDLEGDRDGGAIRAAGIRDGTVRVVDDVAHDVPDRERDLEDGRSVLRVHGNRRVVPRIGRGRRAGREPQREEGGEHECQ